MLTIGYGDIAPVNAIERMYITIMSMLSTGIFGYAISTIGSIF